jgi:hypothetical protein
VDDADAVRGSGDHDGETAVRKRKVCAAVGWCAQPELRESGRGMRYAAEQG